MSTDELFDFFAKFDDAYRPMSAGHRRLWGKALKERDADRVFKALSRAMADGNNAPSLRKFQGKYLSEVNEWENQHSSLNEGTERATTSGEPIISFQEWKRRHPEEWAACEAKLGNSVFATAFRHQKEIREREPGEDDVPGFGVEDMVDGHLPWEEER